jgi:protein required for attachment to host cells
MATTWIVAADASRARIFEMGARVDDDEPREIDDLHNPEGRMQDREINTDAHGRLYGGNQPRAHSAGQQVTPEQHHTELFSKEVGRYLDKARTQHRYEKLCVIAPPEFLGLMRKNMTDETKKLVDAEINKDLSKSGPAEIRRVLEEKRQR